MHYDYKGRTVFVGIDVHKKTYSVVAYCEKESIKKWTAKAVPDALAKQLKRLFDGAEIVTAYEAGFSGYVLHRCLASAGVESQVVHAGNIETAVNDKVKTDKRDANKLAQQLAAGRLKSIYIPSEEQELARLLSRRRATAAKERTRAALRIKSKLHQFGLIGPDEKLTITQRQINQLKCLELAEELKFVLGELIDDWCYFNGKVNLCDKRLKEQAKTQPHLEQVYQSVPGIGATSSRVLSNQLGDTLHFRNSRNLASYTGLTPSERSSGQSCRRGGITRCGPAQLRGILVQCAWRAIKQDTVLRDFFNQLSQRSCKQKAIIAVARKLLLRIRACFLHDTLYELGKAV